MPKPGQVKDDEVKPGRDGHDRPTIPAQSTPEKELDELFGDCQEREDRESRMKTS